jgi:hypothetical protein
MMLKSMNTRSPSAQTGEPGLNLQVCVLGFLSNRLPAFPPSVLSPDSSWPSFCCVTLILTFHNLYSYHINHTLLIIFCV